VEPVGKIKIESALLIRAIDILQCFSTDKPFDERRRGCRKKVRFEQTNALQATATLLRQGGFIRADRPSRSVLRSDRGAVGAGSLTYGFSNA